MLQNHQSMLVGIKTISDTVSSRTGYLYNRFQELKSNVKLGMIIDKRRIQRRYRRPYIVTRFVVRAVEYQN